MAIESEQGNLLVLLPESKTWIPLEPAGGFLLAEGLKNSGGWRMEVVEGAGYSTLYFPTVNGLAAVTPSLIGLSYAVEDFGAGLALGGPVALAGDIWLPVLGRKGDVNLVGKPRAAAKPIVLPTSATAPKNGFEAPVFDPLHVIWPSEEGQLILRLDENGKKKTDWIGWPDGLRPTFSLGCPYLSPSGSFWQLCWKGQNESFEYVQMGKLGPERAAVDAPRLGTGHISYKNDQRIEGNPWSEPEHVSDAASSEVVVPLIESELERAVVGLRIDAPRGVLALLESDKKKHRAVLQLQAEGRAEIPFGTLSVTRPWLASLFIYDGHLWVYHPELSQALGWKVENRLRSTVAAPARPRTAHAANAIDVRMKVLAQSARAESLCEFCGRPWFGLVANCPFCGRKPGFPTIKKEHSDSIQSDEALAREPGAWGMPAGELNRQGAKSPRKEPPRMLLEGVPILGETLPRERKTPTASQPNKKTSTFLFKVAAAGVSVLLLFWMMVKLPAPAADEGASPRLPRSTSGIASTGGSPSTSAAPMPSIPLRSDTAVPAANQIVRQQEREAAPAAPQSRSQPLCSMAHETAGLCNSK